MELSIDTKNRKITLDGKPMDTLTELQLVWHPGEPAQVKLTADSDVNLEIEVFGDLYNDIFCPECGRFIGKINAVGRIYGLRCPHCGGDIARIAPCGIDG